MSWIRNTIGLATFAFINLALFIVFSNPFGLFLDTLEDQADLMGVNTTENVSPHFDAFRHVFGIFFVMGMVGLIIQFFLGSHRDEYESYPDYPRRPL